MAQFLISVWHDAEYEVDFTSPDMQRRVAQVGAFNQQLVTDGALVFAGGLQPASTATSFRLANGEVGSAAGPYAGAAPQMGGFWVIDVADAATAEDLARQAAAACEDQVELRAFQGAPE
jgi:hypothetical protein